MSVEGQGRQCRHWLRTAGLPSTPEEPSLRRVHREVPPTDTCTAKRSRRLRALLIRAALLSVLRLCTPRLQSKPTISTQFAPFPAGYLPISVRAPLASSIA